MARNKVLSRKLRYAKSMKTNSSVPSWIVVRTNRRVRTHPKRRSWRQVRVKK
ncbi:MAG: 50S ribosomal protein L39e [Candidatus Heimdallarchaeum aukensis]|uniref:Large ribosomal subunit protein eL39 n=2 Tax=Candidatus Heimdallarchaeum TaxID=3053649 RepID=A0A9Y1BPK4_9ARCH|nr:MAG: 50S ribosomal protein L39e [Candidatus Heimdallarchaeum aukensis]UJG42636.1 MAG: 50S ribosomal protein L39e [Candidatus Heimdallarchaeum endolithica]